MALTALARREEQVLRLVAEGWSATAIAARLKISPKTVETQRQRGYEKLGLNRRTLVRYAVKAGWLGLFLLAAPLQAQRTYWPVSVDSLATGKVLRTHVQTTGLVTLVRHEGDGDLHFKVVGQRGFVVCECIPTLPCRIPKVGEHLTVKGISRWDGEHKWAEVHPVEWLSP